MRKNEYPVLFFSNKLYYKLLKVYPVKHRQRFRDEMAQVFRNLCRDIYSRQGLTGLMGLWFITFFDLLKTALEERLKEVSHMTKEKFIRLSGWALMLGGVTFILGFGLGGGETSFDDPLGGPDAIYEYGQLVLVPVAMLFSQLVCWDCDPATAVKWEDSEVSVWQSGQSAAALAS